MQRQQPKKYHFDQQYRTGAGGESNMPLASYKSSMTQTQSGFTLVEVLVAVVVLAVGLLGLAGLQVTSVRFNNSAYLRSQATNLAYDIADRIRANRSVALASPGAYDSVAIQSPPPACALPSGTGVICKGTLDAADNCTVIPGSVFSISVIWDDSRGQSPVQRFRMMTQL
jgi:type IV pilus assembly protein PilV